MRHAAASKSSRFPSVVSRGIGTSGIFHAKRSQLWQSPFLQDLPRKLSFHWRESIRGIFLVFSNGVGIDDDEIRTGNAMIIDPYGRILSETSKADDDMVIADLDASLLEENTGKRWIRTRRPELYGLLAKRTGLEQDIRTVRFDRKGV